MSPYLLTWIICGVAVAGVIVRPLNLPEAIWAVAGAVLLVIFGLLTPAKALAGIAKGTDVYLFLIGMMLLAEVARKEGLFDWLAALAASHANGSPQRLFLLTYGVGTVVTIFLSNDATAVVLTPAVAAAMRTAKVEEPLPYLLICAFIANAASFVLPISNPANLVIYGSSMPPLLVWLPRYIIPSALSIAATYVTLRWSQRHRLDQEIATSIATPALSTGGRLAALGIGATAIALLIASTMNIQLGLPTCIAGTATALAIFAQNPRKVLPTLHDVSWSVIPMVAGLFVLVEALIDTGVIAMIGGALGAIARKSETWAAWYAGLSVSVVSNLANNLPVGLIAGSALQDVHAAAKVTSAVLIGVDIGPNLSVTGSLATILWLTALRRDGHHIGAMTFLRVGAIVMLPALLLALASVILLNR